jgi:tetratricopeptide (TPR) repeat protein
MNFGKRYIIIIVVIIAALATGLLLMPGKLELALMEMKDKHFAEARHAYEEQLAGGNLSLDVVTHLTDLYLQVGAIDKAIEVMEKFVAQHPNHLEARTKLGTLYQYAQRPEDYQRNLEAINQIKMKPENLVALSSIYNFSGQYDKQTATLQKLITVDQGKNPKYYTDLANIQAAKHDYAGAIATLRELQKNRPDQFSFENTALLVALLLDNKQQDEALKTADAYVQAHNNPDQSAEMVNILHFQGSAALGDTLIARFNDTQINSNASLLDAYILLLLSDGKEDAAYNRLKNLYTANKLPTQLNGRLLFLAASHGDRELAHQILKGTELTTLSETQLVALVELAQAQDDELLLKDITAAFPQDQYYKSYPVLTAAIAVANQRKDAEATLARLDSSQMENEKILQIANICSRAHRYSCVDHFLQKLPSSDKLSDAEVASVGDLYLNMHQYDTGYAYLHTAMQTRKSLLIESVAIEFAAARGEDKEVKDWLNSHPDQANPRMLTDLYYAALNNKHPATASMIAEIFHDKYNTAMSRSLLANAYIKSGKYKQAVDLLRENSPKTKDDEYNYLTALVKLAPHDAQYRAELRTYAGEKLHSGISGNQKLAFVYGLVDAHQYDIAMPYIKELALKNGGQWASLYAELLDKEGKYAEARTFWLEVANQRSTTLAEKKSIAFNLLDHGDKADAEKLFMQVAANEGPGSEDVKDLIYLMGPRPTADEMAWLESRYASAPARDKARWATIIDETATPEYFAEFVKRHPESMNDPKITEDYFQIMSNQGKLASMENGYIAYTKKYGTTGVLHQYAAAAESANLKQQALEAYETIVSVDPTDYTAIREAGIIAYEQADYKTSSKYLGDYTKYYQTHPVNDDKAYLAYFYYGETLRHAHQGEQAKPYYHTALTLMGDRQQTAEAVSIKAQSQVWSGDINGGFKTFDSAVKTYPESDSLRADYISTLLDLHRYDEARNLFTGSLHPYAAASSQGAINLPAFAQPVKSYTLLSDNTELLIHFRGPVNDDIAANLKNAPWVNYTSEGYDTLLIEAKPGYKFQTAAGAPKTTMNVADNAVSTIQIVADNAHSPDTVKADKQMGLRYELMHARTDLETGHIYNATKRLSALQPEYKDNPEVLGFTANAENYGGNWPEAATLLNKAQKIAPTDADILELKHDLRRDHAPNVTLDFEWVDYAHTLENITTIKGYVNATDHVIVGASLQDNYEQGKNLRLSDGRVGDFNGNREQGEIYAMYHTTNGIRVQGSLFGNNDTAGAGGYFSFLNPLGDTLVYAEYHKPYWDLPEAVLDDANRDRVAFLHTIKPTDRLTIDGGLGLNRYNTKDDSDVITSVSAQADIVYRLIEGQMKVRPTINIGYGLDGEYTRTDKESFDSTGSVSRALPLFSREIHSVYGEAAYEFSPTTYGDVILGYEYDRLGGNGPLIEGKINHEFNNSIDGQLRASYSLDPTQSANTITRIGAYVRWRF